MRDSARPLSLLLAPCLLSLSLGRHSLSPRLACRLPGRAAGVRVGGSLVAICLLGWSRRGECGDYVNYLFSVDYFGCGGYIDTRALIGFSFLCVLARAFMLAALLWVSVANIALVYRPNKTVPPGQRAGAIFFYRFSFHLIPSLDCLLTCGLLLHDYSHIHIAPSIRPATLDTEDGEGMGCDTADGGGLSCLPHADGDGWQRWRNGCDVVIA